MPMIGHLAEAGVVIHEEFREGSITPASRNLDVMVKAFRLIVVKHKHQTELFDNKSRYCVAASNRTESVETTLIGYRKRSEVSENCIKELKIGFGMERMPCGQFEANPAFFRIGVIAHNLFVLFKHSVIGGDWRRHRVVTLRWRLFHLPGTLASWFSRSPPSSSSYFRTSAAKATN